MPGPWDQYADEGETTEVIRQAPPGSRTPEDLVPAIRLIGGDIVAGQHGDVHPDIIGREGLDANEIDQRGFVDSQGNFFDREASAQATQLETQREPGRLHSTDLIRAADQAGPWAQFEPTKEPDLSKVKPSAYEKIYLESGLHDPGMLPGTELTTAVAEALPGALQKAEQAIGWVPRYAIAAAQDMMIRAAPAPFNRGLPPPTNVREFLAGRETPGTKFVNEAARYAPNLAVLEKTAESTAEMAPLAMIGALPSWARRLVTAGFTLDMIRNAGPQAQELGEEMGKPAEEQDAGKIADLKSSLGMTALFAPIAGAHGFRPVRTLQELSYAIQRKGPQVLRPVRNAPGEGEGQVPVERAVPQDDAGRRQEGQLPQEGQAGLLLKPEDRTIIEEERQALDHPEQLVYGEENLPEGEPFAPNTVATINRQTGKIVVNPEMMSRWMSDLNRRGLSAEQKRGAVRAMYAEEGIHLATTPDMATDYFDRLSGVERALETRLYTGKWGRARAEAFYGREFDATDLGYEAIRRRMQQLARMTTTEVAERAGRERWTLQGLEALNRSVRAIREKLGTKASREQIAILDKVQVNLNAGIIAAGGAPAKLTEVELEEKRKTIPPMRSGEKLVSVERPDGSVYLAASDPAKPPPDVPGFQDRRWRAVQVGDGWSHGITAKGEKVIEDNGAKALSQEPRREPAALYRKDKGTPEMFLPPVPSGAALEREGFAQPTSKAIDSAADAHFADISQAPSLDRFRGELQSRYGANISKDAVYYAWQDAMFKRLETAKGSELDKLVSDLGLRGKLQEEHQTSFKEGSIPDPIDVKKTRQAQFEEMAKLFPYKKKATPRAVREWFGPQLRKRYAAIGAIAEKLTKQAGPKPEKAWTRRTIGPEEVNQVMGDRQWYTISPEEAANPEAVGKLATTGAALHAEGTKAPPRSVTKSVLAVEDAKSKIHIVSAWKDGRRGPVVTDPANPKGSSQKLDSAFLKKYTPRVVMQLREPVQAFHQVFDDQAAFDQYFGDIAIEGTKGIRTSSFAGPQAGTARSQAGLTGAGQPPPAEAVSPPPLPAPSPTGRELTMPRFARRAVPAEPVPPTGLPPRAEAARMLPPGQQPAASAGIEPSPFFRTYPYEVSKPVGVSEVGKPAPRQPGTEYRAGLSRETARRAPGALLRTALTDEAKAVKSDVEKLVRAWPVGDTVARMAENSANRAHIIANQAEQRVRFASALKPTELRGRIASTWQRGNKQVLAAANALVEAKAVRADGSIDPYKVRTELPIFRQLTEKGLAKAQAMEASPNWHERRIGRAWVRNQENLLAELDYAAAHWGDADLQQTAARVSEAYRDEIDLERSKGYDITEKPGYEPHRYDAALWNGSSFLFQLTAYEQKILGRKFRESQLFPSYYHAGEAGPYLAVTRDAASLVGHRVRAGQNMILQDAWKDGLENVRLPDGRPLAVKSVASKAARRWLSPKADYKVVPGANHLAIQDDYVSLVRALTDPSHVEMFGPSRAALHLSQQIKHSILVGDFFHMGRMAYYGASILGAKAGYKSGWSVLDIAERDMAEAVRKGIIRQKDMDWANTQVPFGRGTITRRQLAEKFYSQMGANLGRVQDALYKDLLTELTPTSGALRRGFVRIIDPSIGRYNRFLFDKLTRGLMAESNVREFERQMRANPNLSPHTLMRDIARDVNNFYGNIGRQGWFKSRTWQDLMRIFWLAPQWVEGLVKKEAVGYSRLTGASRLAGARRGLTPLGTTGRAIGSGMLAMVALTQGINLITRGKPTWKNEEEHHKFDAWIPGWGADSEGFWLSPMAIYNEVSHDLYRLISSKPTVADALAQIAANKQQPVTRALMVAITGQSPLGQKLTTTGSRIKSSLAQLAPVPISFGRVGQAAGHAVAPGVFPPPPPGAVQRQAFATAGIKIEPKESAVQETADLARNFMREEGLEKETGWQQIQTDQPGYTKLRSALRSGDDKEARRNFEALLKTRSERDINQAMSNWARRGFTGSLKTEKQFKGTLNERELELYSEAVEQKQLLLEKWREFLAKQP